MTIDAILLPGRIMPAELGGDVRAVAKDLEVYAGPEPPVGYSLDHEIAGALRAAQDAGLERFHLVGYSGGGASSLAFAATHREEQPEPRRADGRARACDLPGLHAGPVR